MPTDAPPPTRALRVSSWVADVTTRGVGIMRRLGAGAKTRGRRVGRGADRVSTNPRCLFPPPSSQPQPALLRRLYLTAAALDGPSSVFARLRAAVDARRSDVAALLDATLAAARGSDDHRATLLPHVLRDALTSMAGPGPHPDGGALEEIMAVAQEAVVVPPCVGIALRPTAGRWVYVRLCSATLRCDELTTAEYLGMKETLVSGGWRGRFFF